jgi:PST family polysaccharide transporter
VNDQSNPDPLFDTEHLQTDFRGRTVRGGTLTIAAEAIKFVVTMGSLPVLARILSPGDYGLIAMVMVLAALATEFRHMGLAAATIQQKDITREQISTLFWVNSAMGGALMLLMAALSPLVAWFYNEPKLLELTAVLSLTFLLGGLSVQHLALLRRQMRFASLAKVEVGATVLSVAAAITSAVLGAGFWSLTIMHLSRTLLILLGAALATRWLPSKPTRAPGTRAMLRFGFNLAIFNTLSLKVREFDRLLLGWQLGSATLGLYANAHALLLIPLGRINLPLTLVALPTLSRLHNDPDRYRLYYRQGILLLTSLTLPLVCFCAAAAPQLVPVVLGDQWLGAIPIFTALAPAALAVSLAPTTRWVFVSTGNTARQLRFALVSAPCTLLGIIVGLQYGPVGVAMGLGIALLLLRIPELIYCFRAAPGHWTDPLRAAARPFIAAILASAPVLWFAFAPPIGLPNEAITLAVQLTLFALLYAAIWTALPGGVRELRQVLALAKDLKPSS